MGKPDLSKNRYAIAVLALTMGLLALAVQDVVMKDMAARYSSPELLLIRGVFALILFQIVLIVLRQKNPLRTARLGWQWMRGFLLFMALACYYIALSVLSLLDTVAIFFSAPLIATALSRVLLKERVSVGKWMAVVVGFCGALLVVRPGGESLAQVAGLIGVAAACFYAGSIIATRYLGETDRAITTAYYTMLSYIVFAGIATLLSHFIAVSGHDTGALAISRVWVTPTPLELGYFAFAGTTVCIGFFCLAQAYKMAEVSSLSPWEYTNLIMAAVIGYIAWGDIPDLTSVIGSVLIIVSGVYVARTASRD